MIIGTLIFASKVAWIIKMIATIFLLLRWTASEDCFLSPVRPSGYQGDAGEERHDSPQ